MNRAYIKEVSYYLPKKILKNIDLIKEFPEWSVEKVTNKIGISERHISAENETSLDMAVRAAENLFEEHNIRPDEIDFIILCTQSPDYFLPTSACILQNRLGIRKSCGALDINLGCSGFVYGLAIAKGLLLADIAENVLFITSETYSKMIHIKDKGNRAIFGDAAAATLISKKGFAEILNFNLGTDGSGSDNLIMATGAFRHPAKKDDAFFNEEGNLISSDHIFMNGTEILSFTLETVPLIIQDILLKNNLTKEEIKTFIFHQANKYILEFLKKKLKIEEERFYYFIEKIGNTVSSTIPIALYEARQEGKIDGYTLISGFGVGYSWGGCVLKTSSESIEIKDKNERSNNNRGKWSR